MGRLTDSTLEDNERPVVSIEQKWKIQEIKCKNEIGNSNNKIRKVINVTRKTAQEKHLNFLIGFR